jgi:phosphoglycerate dehydrogenase-like enzyme
MRLLTQMHGDVPELVRERFPEVEVVEVPLEGDPGPDVEGDALLVVPTLATNVAQLAPRVQWLHAIGTGVGELPDEAFAVPLVTCSRGYGIVPIAEFVLMTMLAFEKRVPELWLHEAPGRWHTPHLGGLAGRTVGLIGIGGIGQGVARRALAFDMEVVAFRRRDLAPPFPEVCMVRSLEELMPQCDHLVVAAPHTARTHHLLDARAFELVRPGVHLVNVSRGGLVDQQALRVALDDGRVAMASLDAVDPEPLPAGHWLYSHPRVHLSSHISWSSHAGQSSFVDLFLDNLGRYVAGEPLNGIVDPVERY